MNAGRLCSRVVATAAPTDRDIAVRCVAAGLDPKQTAVSIVMTTPARTVSEDTPLEEAVVRMAGTGTRRLVVIGK